MGAVVVLLLMGQAVDRAQNLTDSNRRLTVIGCVRRAVPNPAAAAPVEAERKPVYELSNITLASEGDSAGRGETPGEVLSQAITAYRLDGSPLVAQHVGERVEVAGTVAPTPASPAAPAPSAAVPVLRVETLRVISSHSSVCLP